MLLPHFICEWVLSVRADEEQEALRLASDYISRYHHPCELRGQEPDPHRGGHWLVRYRSTLNAPTTAYADAMYELLEDSAHYGYVEVSAPFIRPDGSSSCLMMLPFLDDEDLHEPFSRVAWWRQLMNYEDERDVKWMHGAVPNCPKDAG